MAADRIRVLPGTILSLPKPPPPPSQPPPKPVYLCKIAVIGDSSSGKTCLVDKFLLRKSCATPIHTGNNAGSNTNNNNVNVVQWCNASTTSQGTFGSAVGGASSSFGTGAVVDPSASSSSLAEYSKKDIALKTRHNKKKWISKRTNRQSPPPPCQCQQETEEEMTTTCVRAQVWDVNVPQSAMITSQDNGNCNGNSSNNSVVNSTTSSITSPPTPTPPTCTTTPLQYNHPTNNNSNLAPLLPLLKRINGIILTCQCPSPPSLSLVTQSQSPPQNNESCNNSSNNNNNSVQHYWRQELELLEVQIANWVNFIKRYVVVVNDDGVLTASAENIGSVVGSNSVCCGTDRNESNNDKHSSSNKRNNNHNQPHKIFIMLTFADQAITQYSPNEWMSLSVKMEEICAKFELIHSWRMGTCVCSSSSSSSVVDGGDVGGNDEDDEATKQRHQQQQQQRQYGLLQRMARQQQQMMEEMEDSVEALFIDMILMHLEGGIE